MPFLAIVPALTVLVGDALTATGAVVDCYALHRCNLPFEPAVGVNSTIVPKGTVPSLAKMRFENRQVGLCGVPQYNFDICQDQLRGVVVVTSIPASGVAQFDNVPPACMDLSAVLGGGCGVNPPYPIVCGSACLQYSGLTADQFNQLGQALAPYAH